MPFGPPENLTEGRDLGDEVPLHSRLPGGASANTVELVLRLGGQLVVVDLTVRSIARQDSQRAQLQRRGVVELLLGVGRALRDDVGPSHRWQERLARRTCRNAVLLQRRDASQQLLHMVAMA